jgi:hypothetical protein
MPPFMARKAAVRGFGGYQPEKSFYTKRPIIGTNGGKTACKREIMADSIGDIPRAVGSSVK